MMNKDLTWNKILTGYSEKLLKFVLNANLLTLATPDNLRRWNVASDIPCGLCTKPNVTLSHILAGCPWVLAVENKFNREDRNTWRHNCVLLYISGAITEKVKEVNHSPVLSKIPFIKFVPAASKPSTTKSTPTNIFSLLSNARDWIYDFDLPEFRSNGASYCFPRDVDVNGIRCDGYLLSRSTKTCIVIELPKITLSIGTLQAG